MFKDHIKPQLRGKTIDERRCARCKSLLEIKQPPSLIKLAYDESTRSQKKIAKADLAHTIYFYCSKCGVWFSSGAGQELVERKKPEIFYLQAAITAVIVALALLTVTIL